jgi:3-hydroxyisobutyrate dehydrogenase-like beta-hydroxyacid dehydrogenase
MTVDGDPSREPMGAADRASMAGRAARPSAADRAADRGGGTPAKRAAAQPPKVRAARGMPDARGAGEVTIGLLHPGEMGAALGHELRARGYEVLWASGGRSDATARRAAAAGLTDCGRVAELVVRSGVIISVCPPHAADQVARQVAAEVAAHAARAAPQAEVAMPPTMRAARAAGASRRTGAADAHGPADAEGTMEPIGTAGMRERATVANTAGRTGVGAADTRLFVDANAISPATSRRIKRLMTGQGMAYVDGGIIGMPPPSAGGTRLYLSGPDGDLVRDLFTGTAVEALVVGDGAGAASAVKMAYAAWTKGTAALALAIRALACAEGVENDLLAEWSRSQPALADRSRGAARSALLKGWRWVAEMEEISASFASAGLPGGFHEAAADVFRRTPYTDVATADEAAIAQIVAALLTGAGTAHPGIPAPQDTAVAGAEPTAPSEARRPAHPEN